ncbi:structure-specific recognition protein-domain-containing protein [Melampsora americana]|nr:structure-specific recognition protein-domain-containing protein [Melampsora americana]
MTAAIADFENIFRGLGTTPGKLRLAASGLGWKPVDSNPVVTVSKDEIKWVQWIKVARGYQLRIGLNRDRSEIKIGDRRRITFDGFRPDDHDKLANLFKQHFHVTLETKDMSLRGWNWGKADVQASDLAFMVAGKPSFEVPLAYVHNASITKTEVALEFLDESLLQPKADGLSGSSKNSRRTVTDQLVELRLYVPGNASSNNAADNGTNAGSDLDDTGDGDGDGMSAAQALHDMVMEKAEIGRVQGQGITTFPDVLCTTPRGRYDIDMYSDFLRLRGKTYDYKVLYSSILRLFLLPKPDDIHFNFVVQLDPPIRQGQTRYPFLVMQFAKDEEMDAELELDNETLISTFQQEHNKVEGQAHEVVSIIFKGLARKKIIFPQNFTSVTGQTAVKCSMKTNEGLVYFLDKYILFISKQPLLVALSDLHSVKFARVGGALQSGRTFDLVLKKKDEVDLQFSSLSKEEHTVIDEYFKGKGKKVLNEMNEDVMTATAAALSDDEDEQMDEDSADDSRKGEKKAGRGGDDEDDESGQL